MSVRLSQRSGKYRARQSKQRDLTVCWANVQKGGPKHDSLLRSASDEAFDVICVQEPYSHTRTITKNHPQYDCYAPIDDWEEEDKDLFNELRPRVMTYVRKGAGLRVQQRRPMKTRDMLWINVNGRAILNIYRTDKAVLNYVVHLQPPPNCLVGGDFNVWHDMFEPGVTTRNGGQHLAMWATESGMDYIGEPGMPTQNDGHVIDLSFSNIPFAETTVRFDLHCGSDHEVLATIVPGRGRAPLEQFNYRIPESELPKFAGLIQNAIPTLPDPWMLQDETEINEYVEALSAAFDSAIKTAGKPDRGTGPATPWWTDKCKWAYQAHLARRNHADHRIIDPAQKDFLAEVRRAKADYWKKTINGVSDDQSLYKVIGWNKLTPNLKSPPLEVGGVLVEDTLEKAEVLRREVLGRFDAADDLEEDPVENWNGPSHLGWDQTISFEEVERNTIGVSSTSPGTDRITVRLLKACWEHVGPQLHGLYARCLSLSYFPQSWKLAEVAMLPKVGKKDKSSVRSWRPIALLSCVGKGLERTIARRIAWTALTNGIFSSQHAGALPKRATMDLVASLTHDIEIALSRRQHITVVTMDVQGAFDAVLRRRLLRRMIRQGWPRPCIKLVESFLSDRQVRVRLEKETTPFYAVACGTPQGSPLSPVLYMLYLEELLQQDPTLRFGYADDILLYRASHSLDDNVAKLALDVQSILDWGAENKVAFAPEKLEMIHLTNQRNNYSPDLVVNEDLTITAITTAPKTGQQPALRWLGVWFDRKLSFKRHVEERSAKARRVAFHIRGLGRTVNGPPADALRKAVITCVLPSILFGNEAWYAGRKKPPKFGGKGRNAAEVSCKNGGLVETVNKTLAIAARGVLPVWRTTPLPTLFRDSGLPSGIAALEEAKGRFAMRLQTVDSGHPLVKRITPPMITRGRGSGHRQQPKSKVQRLGAIYPEVPRPKLVPPRYTTGSRTNPTNGIDKETAAAAFKEWWKSLPPEEVTIFSDGSEQYVEGNKYVGYGYAIYQGQHQLATGSGAISNMSHVFDAEAIGAWKALERTTAMPPEVSNRKLWMCIDSTSVIWGMRGNASPSSQWAFLNCHGKMDTHNIGVRWSPGHTGIEGNEAADKLADIGAFQPPPTTGYASLPTISGLGTINRKHRSEAQQAWWDRRSTNLSTQYKRWNPTYSVQKLPELSLPRHILHRHIAIRTTHGDFSWYHRRFRHLEAELKCACGKHKTPLHLVLCQKTQKHFFRWPVATRPQNPPSNKREAIDYLRELLDSPKDFEGFLKATEFYSKICTR